MKIVLFANSDWYLYNFRRSFLTHLKNAGHDILLITPPGSYSDKFSEMGLRWSMLPMDRRSLNPFSESKLLFHLFRLFRREKPQLVHSFTVKSAVYGGLAARFAGVPARVSAVAGLGYVFTSSDIRARILRPIVRMLMKLAFGGPKGRLICQNPDDANLLISQGVVSKARTRLIYGSGVDCVTFHPSERVKLDSKTPFRVLMAARLLWEKGVDEYVSAARKLKSNGEEIEFLLAGTPDSGNPASVSDSELKEWIKEGAIRWLGHIDNMAELFQAVDAVVLPSYYGEGLPKSLIEAAASGLPIITTDMPGCREAVSHGVSGILIEPKNSGALADAIEVLHKDPLLVRQYGMAARQKALQIFDHQIVIEKTLDVYRELAE